MIIMKVIKKESAKTENKNIIELPEEVSIELADRTIVLEKGERIEVMSKVGKKEEFVDDFSIFSKKYGEVFYGGESYALTEVPEYTYQNPAPEVFDRRLFPSEVNTYEGENYYFFYTALAIDEENNEYIAIWVFDNIKKDDDNSDDYDIDFGKRTLSRWKDNLSIVIPFHR